jgi:hypothetical protein
MGPKSANQVNYARICGRAFSPRFFINEPGVGDPLEDLKGTAEDFSTLHFFDLIICFAAGVISILLD